MLKTDHPRSTCIHFNNSRVSRNHAKFTAASHDTPGPTGMRPRLGFNLMRPVKLKPESGIDPPPSLPLQSERCHRAQQPQQRTTDRTISVTIDASYGLFAGPQSVVIFKSQILAYLRPTMIKPAAPDASRNYRYGLQFSRAYFLHDFVRGPSREAANSAKR